MAEEKKGSTAPSKAVTAVKKENAKLGFFKRIGKWFREMRSDLKKIVWPTRKQLTANSLTALGMMVLSAILIWGLDVLAGSLIDALFKLAG